MFTKRFSAFVGGLLAVILVVAAMGASIGPWPVVGSVPQGTGSITGPGASYASAVYLSSGGTAATSVVANKVTLQASTANITLYATSGGTVGFTLPYGVAPITIDCTNLNQFKVSGGTTATLTYLYHN